MLDQVVAYPTVRGLKAVQAYGALLRDPIRTARRYHEQYGAISIVALPYRKRDIVIGVGGRFNREVLDNPNLWWTVNLSRGPKNSAVRRLGRGIISMQGAEHEHYRRLMLPTLRRRNIDARGEQMGLLAEHEIDSWAVDGVLDLRHCARRLLQAFAVSLLFGGDRERGVPIAEMIHHWMLDIWSANPLCPINIPGMPYHGMLKNASIWKARSLIGPNANAAISTARICSRW
jgi:cytochrome P450